MNLLKRLMAKSELLVPVSVAACAALIAFDLIVFFAFGRRPFISYAETQIAVWTVLIACGWVFGARWLVMGEKRSRFALAGSLALMVTLSALHPYQSGALRTRYTPTAEPVVATPASDNAVVEYRGGPLSEGRRLPA